MRYLYSALPVILLGMVSVALFVSDAQAWPRVRYEDAQVVERSEVIAIAHIKRESIRFVRSDHWEHQARLVITEVLKGALADTEIPITIHFGLLPVVGGYVKRPEFMVNLRTTGQEYPKDHIAIIDFALPAVDPIVPDAGCDHLWFLRRRSGPRGEQPGTLYGIVDPEDLRPLALKEYFLAYLSPDPAAAGTLLVPFFKQPQNQAMRREIIDMWTKKNYRGSVELLIQMLEQHESFWAGQHLEKDWWNRELYSQLTRQRHLHYREDLAAVIALHRLRDPRARAVIEQARKRWLALGLNNSELIEECDRALAAL
jgi:hypothetical protein